MNRSVKGKILNTKVGICKGMRIHTDLNEEERERVMKYSKEKGLRLKRAYTELIKKGLDSEGY